ncbi:MAG: hypothetical protein ACOCV2_01995 [Persicimonas sp.]
MSKRNALNLLLVALTSLALAVGACSGDDNNGSSNSNEQGNDASNESDSNGGGDGGNGGEDAYNPCADNENRDTECGGECVDVTENEDHCGACDRSCPTAGLPEEAGCYDGTCECGDDERTYCEGTNSCTLLDRDRNNCGECGNDCGDDLCWVSECMTHAERIEHETNEWREKGDEVDCIGEKVDPVELDDALTEAAQTLSQEAVDNNGQVESDPAQLAADEGYEGEVINATFSALGQELPERFYQQQWLEADDPAICELLMNAEATDLGVGMVFGELEGDDGQTFERYVWTIIIGK